MTIFCFPDKSSKLVNKEYLALNPGADRTSPNDASNMQACSSRNVLQSEVRKQEETTTELENQLDQKTIKDTPINTL